MYHMVTGQPPFPGSKIDDVLRGHLKQELVPPDHLNTSLSSGLGEVVEFTMAKQYDQRYQNLDDLIFDLECLLNHKPPKLARERIASGTLEALAQGESEAAETEDENAMHISWVWLAVSGTLLAVSVLFNLILILKRN
jgi:serine/threonine-protein kinase